jgi:anti-sigma B factor antagonist
MFWTHSSSLLDIPVLELHGDLDVSAHGAWDALAYQIAQHPRVVADLKKLEYLDAAGLRLLIRARKRCERLGGWLILADPQGIVRRILDVMNMDREFLIWEEILDDSG